MMENSIMRKIKNIQIWRMGTDYSEWFGQLTLFKGGAKFVRD